MFAPVRAVWVSLADSAHRPHTLRYLGPLDDQKPPRPAAALEPEKEDLEQASQNREKQAVFLAEHGKRKKTQKSQD